MRIPLYEGADEALADELQRRLGRRKPIYVLCAGTDRWTGDALGPLVGEALKGHCQVAGTLHQPLRAEELVRVWEEHRRDYHMVAVDSALGSREELHHIVLSEQPLLLGSGIHKNTPIRPDLTLYGVVNLMGGMHQMTLQNTRLYHVMGLARTVAAGLIRYLTPEAVNTRICSPAEN